MPSRFPALACSIVLAFSFLARPSLAQDPARDHDVTLDDLFEVAWIEDISVSPDGRFVAYTETRWESGDWKRNTDVWVVECETLKRTRLTFDPASDSSPRWSPDGQWIYFQGSPKRGGESKPPYDGKAQVFRVGALGGDPQPVTRVEGGIEGFDLATDGGAVFYAASEKTTDEEWSSLRTRHDGVEYGHGVRETSEIWRLDLESWRAEQWVAAGRTIRDFAVSPDGSRVAMHTTPDEKLLSNEGWSRVEVYDRATGGTWAAPEEVWRKAAPSPYGWVEGLAWSDDSLALAFGVSYDGFPTEIWVAEGKGEGATLRQAKWRDGVSFAWGLAWREGTRDLCFLGEERARVRLYAISGSRNGGPGELSTLTTGDVVVGAYSFVPGSADIAVVRSDPTHLDDLWIVSPGEPGAPERRLTDANPQVARWKLPEISLVTWKGAEGQEVEGVLELPPGHAGGEPLPTIVQIHGGPTASEPFCLTASIYGRTLLPARGYAVLSPNYRGSTGYGDKFLVDLVGRENEIEVEDILAGVDAMVERGIADRERLGVMGWSNGGFLTNCVITHTTRFKAASSGAGVLDMVLQFGEEDTPGHVVNYMQGFPWSRADAYRKASPTYALDKVKTPTLIHVGANDERCPPGHSRTLYRALHHYAGVPAELLVYPGEGHGLSKYEHRRAKVEWDHAWFDRYVKGAGN
ncbi:MAG: S9 family peptidase [Planctomycetes bacterium]|nr:S9 family peptidase [Planctomycetota bacterium]